jgi:hypothetical protein
MYLPPTAEHRARPSHPTATHRDKRGRKEPDPGTGDRTQPILPLPPGLGKNCWAMFLLMITLSCLRSAAVKPRPARSRIPKARKYAGSTTQILRYQILAGPCRCASFDSEVDTGSPTSAVGSGSPTSRQIQEIAARRPHRAPTRSTHMPSTGHREESRATTRKTR